MRINNILKRFKSVGIITGSMLIAALIALAALPVLSRLYDSHDFGIYGLVIAFVSVLSTVSSLRLDQAVLVAPEPDRATLAFAGGSVALVVSLAAFLIFLPFKGGFFAGAIGLGVLSNSLLQLNYAILFSYKRDVSCGVLNVLRTLTLVIAQLSLPFFIVGATMLHGLYVQSLVLLALTSILMLRKFKREVFNWSIVSNYRDFVVSNTPHALTNSFSHNVPYYFISYFLGASSVGYYSLVDRVLKVPINVFSQAVRQFYIRDFSVAVDQAAAAKNSIAASLFMAAASAPFFIGLSLLPASFFEWIFGSSWTDAGKYFSILSFGYWAIFINPPVSAFIVACRRSDVLFSLQIVELLLKLLLVFIAFAAFGAKVWILAALSVSLVFYNFSCFLWVLKRRT